MAVPLTAEVLQDDIAQRAIDGHTVWHVNYGPKDYIGQRGGDLIVEVNADDETISRVLRGQ